MFNNSIRQMEFVQLFSGHKMPLVGLGTSARNQEELEGAIEEALKIGYRHFDTAYVYQNEVTIGNVLKRWLDAGKVKREDLFIVTKLPPIGMRRELVGHFLEKSLQNLKLSYVDLYLIHTPVGYAYINDNELRPVQDNGDILLDMATNLESVWGGMESLVEKGLAKSIGISNFAPSQIQRIVNCAKIPPANIQVELNGNFQQKNLQKLCKELNIQICAYSPLGSPGRGKKTLAPPLITNPLVIEMAGKYGKTTAQILLRFLVQKNIVVIPKSFNVERLKSNFEVFNFELTCSDMDSLESLDMGGAGRAFIYSQNGCSQHPEYKDD